MKKTIFALIALLSLSSFGFAQNDSTISNKPELPDQFKRVTIGLRGGLAMTCGNSAVRHLPGGDALLDAQYAMYWRKNSTHLGFLVGASLGYMQTGGTIASVSHSYKEATSDGDVQYTILATNLKEKLEQIVVEIPVMFSLVDRSGVFFNLGPRFSFPAWSKSTVSFTDPNIEAYFPEEGVVVPNEVIMGKVDEWKQGQQAMWNAPVFRMLLGAEIGYEFLFKNLNSLALGLYADCEVASVQKAQTTSQSFINITAPSTEKQPAAVRILSPIDQYAGTLGLFDVGLKIAYHFNLE